MRAHSKNEVRPKSKSPSNNLRYDLAELYLPEYSCKNRGFRPLINLTSLYLIHPKLLNIDWPAPVSPNHMLICSSLNSVLSHQLGSPLCHWTSFVLVQQLSQWKCSWRFIFPDRKPPRGLKKKVPKEQVFFHTTLLYPPAVRTECVFPEE